MTPDIQPALSVFLAHSNGDKDYVREICRLLSLDGFRPWFDEQDLVGGEDWEDTIEEAVNACREKDGAMLRTLLAVEVTDEDLEELFARGSGLRLLAQDEDPEIDAGRATIEVTLDVGATDPLERSWELEEGSDGVWRFTSLPDCY